MSLAGSLGVDANRPTRCYAALDGVGTEGRLPKPVMGLGQKDEQDARRLLVRGRPTFGVFPSWRGWSRLVRPSPPLAASPERCRSASGVPQSRQRHFFGAARNKHAACDVEDLIRASRFRGCLSSEQSPSPCDSDRLEAAHHQVGGFLFCWRCNGRSAMPDGSQALVIVPIDEDGFHGPWLKQQRHWKQC